MEAVEPLLKECWVFVFKLSEGTVGVTDVGKEYFLKDQNVGFVSGGFFDVAVVETETDVHGAKTDLLIQS